MDIRCVKCGEPVEMDALHEEVEHRSYNGTLEVGVQPGDYQAAYDIVRAEYYRDGCKAITSYGMKCTPGQKANPGIAILQDLLGDDIDGFAAMCEDMGMDMEEMDW